MSESDGTKQKRSSRLPVRLPANKAISGSQHNSQSSQGMSNVSPDLRHRKMVPKLSPVVSDNSTEEVLSDGEARRQYGGTGDTSNHGGKLHPRHSPRMRTTSGSEQHRGHYSQDPTNIEMETDIDNDISEPLLANHDRHGDSHLSDDEGIQIVDDGESSFSIGLQAFIPFMIAGFGMVGAGMVLDVVQHWDVFVKISEIFILVPALLGLKGNLEMTLACRLSTQANLGNMDNKKEQWKMIAGNLALTQAQAIVVGFLASVAAMVLGWIPQGKFDMHHGFLLGASSMLTASLASLLLGSIMIVVIVVSRKCRINPDNVATPIAASLGDLITLSVLASIGSVLHNALGVKVWLAPTICAACILLTPFMVYISLKNKYTCEVIYTGWTPIISAMAISSVGGLILDFTVSSKQFFGIAVFQPVINGVGGNLVAVQASRISTALHKVSKPGNLPKEALHGCPNCPSAFFGKGPHARACRVLLSMTIPGHIVFMFTIAYMNAGHTTLTVQFALVYLTAALIQVGILLYVANWMVHWMWKQGDDPDNFAIPYLTALGDLLGTALLALAFHLLYVMGDRDADLGD